MSSEPGTEPVDVDQLKERIAHTREELGQTVEALAAKADVKARATRSVHQAIDGAKARVHELTDGARERVESLAGGGPQTVPAGPDSALLDPGSALAAAQRRAGLDRRLQAILLATAVGAVVGAVLAWVREWRS